MGEANYTAGRYEHRIAKPDDREMSKVTHVDAMADDAEEGERDGEAIDEGKENLDGDDGIDEAGKDFSCEDGVFFNEFGEVV